MRLAIVSSRFPRGNGEPYLAVELSQLRSQIAHVAVEPARRPASARTFAYAAALVIAAPLRALRAVAETLYGSGSARVRLKNLAVVPHAFALAWEFRLKRIEHVHAYWLSVPATVALIIARVNDIPWSATAHRWDIYERNMLAEKVACATFVRAISERGRAELCRLTPQHAQKVSVVRLGTALATSAAIPATRREFRILCAAAFVPVKGHRLLLDAFAQAHRRFPHLRLTLCGTGPLESAMRARAESMPCGNAIAFRGYVPHDHLLGELQAGHYDAVALASIDDGVLMEGVPSILIEAASAGIPCIATRSGAVGELLDDDCAFLAPPGDTEALARAILDAARSPERGPRAQTAARRVRSLHDPVRTATELVRLLATAEGGSR
jgi:colanic acid/amylovoran biosynthesis glycosyltransferase